MLVLFVNLKYATVFDMFTDGISHIFSAHHNVKCFFKSCVSRELQVGVMPTDYIVLKCCRDDHLVVFAQDLVFFTNFAKKTCPFASSGWHQVSVLGRFPSLLMGKSNLHCCDFQTLDSFGLGM